MTKAAVLGAASASLILSGAMGAAAAPAEDPAPGTSALSDNLLELPVTIPITVCGNAISILGPAPMVTLSGGECPSTLPQQEEEFPIDPADFELAELMG
ncbi:chaplin family protein [Streptomyces sp. S.PB5]|uniref:chaplin family protein n=1 Tax=Streptomyces sp. S.PB5 TaxID=3020844 RepID=UPI0025B1C02D|nr:chaplin family protein [Streptomyces sp. S.PB5]MDN3025993.1 chaplin family protein [Streptomyces sp. S.PB5]